MDVAGKTDQAEPTNQTVHIEKTTDDVITNHRLHRAPGQYTYEPLHLEMMCFAPADYVDNDVRNLKMKESDIVIAAYPKTGNTWMQEILWLVTNGADTEKASATPINDRVPFLEYFMHGFSGVQSIENTDAEPRIIYTHLPRDLVPLEVKERKVKVIVMLRDPMDTMVSYYYFSKSYSDLGNYKGSWDDFFYLYQNEKVPYGHVVDHNVSWWKAKDDLNILFVRFEDLLADRRQEIDRIAAFCGVRLTNEQTDKIFDAISFNSMKANPMTNRSKYNHAIDQSISPFMRKGIAGDWRNHFGEEQYMLAKSLVQHKLGNSDLTYPSLE